MTHAIILASSSPRRRELLARIVPEFTIVVPDVDESLIAGESPQAMVERLALLKAQAIAQHHPGAIVIGSDTTVVCDEHILGKPTDIADAQRILAQICGRTHEVLTGVAVVHGAQMQVECARAAVTMRAASAEDIAQYVATGEPMDKAGAYAAQGLGKQFIDHIDGDETTVIGLPVELTRRMIDRIK